MPIGFYIGTYTGHGSDGIYYSQIDPATDRLAPPTLAARTDNPSFLALHPSGNYLYAVNENDPGSVWAFAIDSDTAGFTALNRQASRGAGPCHLSVDPAGECLLVANYNSGSFAAFPIGSDGSIGPAAATHQDVGRGPVADRQDGPHCHGIWPVPIIIATPPRSGRISPPAEKTSTIGYAFACDLGTDQLRLFQLDPASANLTPADPPCFSLPPGTGPRHIEFSRDGRFVYVIGELANTLSVLAIAGLHFEIVQSLSTLPPGFASKSQAAEVVRHPTADILYATNRGADDLITYAIDPATGHLRKLARIPTGGKNPRHFALDPTGDWLLVANEYSNSIVPFKIDAATKIPQRTGDSLAITSPVCILFAAWRQ